jgi:hypothetical protein
VAAADEAARPPAATDEWLLPVRRRLAGDWVQPELPPAPAVLPNNDAEEFEGRVEFYWVGVEARVAGTLAHRFIQLATDGRVTLDKSTIENLRPVTRRWVSESGIDPGHSGAVVQRVERILTGVVDDYRGRWLLDGDGYAELALSGVVDGRVQSVQIDRVRIEDEIHWIVDYKTGRHEGGRAEEFLEAEADRYRGQLRKYATIYRNYRDAEIRCALYFPLLQAFVEVDVGPDP